MFIILNDKLLFRKREGKGIRRRERERDWGLFKYDADYDVGRDRNFGEEKGETEEVLGKADRGRSKRQKRDLERNIEIERKN